MFRRKPLILLFLLTCIPLLGADKAEWLTHYEKSYYLETPRYAETIAFCQKLADFSPMVELTDFGVSPQGRKLPLLIVDKDAEFNPQGEKTKRKVILLVQAGIHAGEIEGKDAGIEFIRDIVVNGKYLKSLDSLVILFIPIFNVDGHERFGQYNRINQNGPREMGWRANAQNLNLNRDFMKADAPEMQCWLKLFNRWLPDFLIDVHTSDGADYQYVITYVLEAGSNVVKPLAEWCTNEFLPEISKRMDKSGFTMSPYIVPRINNDVTSGLLSWIATPRFSNGYGTLQNRPILLIETHMLKPYKQRVESVYQLLRYITDFLNKNTTAYKRLVAQGDNLTANKLVKTYLPISFEPAKDSIMLDFLGVDFHFEHSEISDTTKIIWGKKKMTYRVPYFYRYIPIDSVFVPYAYLIPQEWKEIIARLHLHGIKIEYLAKDTELTVSSYRFSDPKWSNEPFEGRHMLQVEVTPITEKRLYPAGTVVVRLNQRTNRIIVHLLEPRAPDSFVSWGFFDAILETKERAEDYVLEQLAVQMLAENSALKAEFDQKLKSDSAFAKNPQQRLQFFYEHSPYWDKQLNSYPVGVLYDKVDLPLQ